MTRPLTDHERRFVQQVAERLDQHDRNQLLQDAAVASAETINADGSIVRFHLAGYRRPLYRGQHAVPAEGTMQDADGAVISVLLHQDENNRLYELELIRYAEGNLIAPNWETLTIQ